MPFRKSDSSDAGSESRRRSLQRLSSIASFQALNPFARRRSNNTNDSTANSSTSNLSLSSTAANAPQPQYLQSSTSQLFRIEDELTALPIPPVPSHLPSRRSSYICLPDDPIGGMPRSRTFSNLPLPTRARRNTAISVAPSKSHSRLPSAFLSSSRLPSPAASNRKHGMSKLAPREPKQQPIRNRMKRSDTEPLLPLSVEQASNTGRSTAFKENISLSPVKPLPEMDIYDNRDFYGSSFPSRGYANRHGWMDTGKGSEPLLQFDACGENFSSSLPGPNLASHTPKPSFSSPAYRSFREGPATPGRPAPVQRWNSQPILTNVTNRRNSRHGEIQERRLMSGLQPDPPPPPPKTPMTAEALMTGKVKPLKSSSTLQKTSEQSPSSANLSNKPRAPSPQRSGQEITKPEPIPYWCGRFSSLTDRYRNEELAAHRSSAGTPKSKSESDKLHSTEANTRRKRRALEHLHGLCVTLEARESFVVFQLQFAAMNGLPELGRPIQLSLPERKIVFGRRGEEGGGGGGGGGGSGDVVGGSEKRKGTFMERLLRRNRRSLQVVM